MDALAVEGEIGVVIVPFLIKTLSKLRSAVSMVIALGVTQLQSLRFEPRTDSLGAFCFALERQPVAGRQTRHGKILARAAHRLSEAVVADVAEPVKFSIDEQYRLVQPASIGRRVRVGEVSGVVQVPGVARTKTGDAERFD